MAGRRILLGVLVGVLLPLHAVSAEERFWQEGVLLSRKTVSLGRTSEQRRYVYRLRGPRSRYVVVSEIPLPVDLYVPVRFSPSRRHLMILDANGKQHKVSILRRAEVDVRSR